MFKISLEKIRSHSLKQIFSHVLGIIETSFSKNWLNPIATFYLNLRSFPFSQAFRMPVYVYGRPRFYCLSGQMRIEGRIKSGMIRFNQTKPGAPSNMDVQSEILNTGVIVFRGNGFIGTGNKIRVAGELYLGRDFKIADMCNIGVFSKVKIGDHTRVAHRCQILDSNYHYIANFSKRIIPQWKSIIELGNYVWVGNTSTITGGAKIPNFTIIASNSLVGKDYTSIPENSMIGGIPAKFIANGFRRVENKTIENKIGKFYSQNPTGIYEIPEGDTMDLYSLID